MNVSRGAVEPLLLTIPAAAARLGVSRAVMYRIIAKRQVIAISVGQRKRVPVAALERFIAEQIELETAGRPV